MPNDLLQRAATSSATLVREPQKDAPASSAELASELQRIETTEKAAQDRRNQEEFARQRELARFD